MLRHGTSSEVRVLQSDGGMAKEVVYYDVEGCQRN